MKNAIFFIPLLLLVVLCCASVTQKPNPSIFYKRNMALEVNGKAGIGIFLMEKADSYIIKPKRKFDYLIMTTCHREKTFYNQRPIINYTPHSEAEKSEACPIVLQGVSGKHHEWALLEKPSIDYDLPAKITCNGEIAHSAGVSICQARENLLQEIEFDVETMYSEENDCNAPQSEDKKKYLLPISRRECTYIFMDKSERIHRLTTIGYQNILYGN